MTTATASSPSTAAHPWLAALARNRATFAYVLFGLAAALAGLSIWMGLKWGKDFLPVWVWAGTLAAGFLAGGVWLLVTPSGGGDFTDTMRTFVLTLGGLTGFVTTIMAVSLAVPTPWWTSWWPDVLLWVKIGGPDPALEAAERTKAGWHIIVLAVALLSGLFIMLISFQLGQTDIRTSPSMRRLLYGYNALLNGFLILVILAVANAFVGTKFSRPLDFTESNIFSMSERGQSVIVNLDKPVTVYALLAPERMAPGMQEMVQTMLNNAQDLSKNFHWEEINSEAKARDLEKRYPAIEVGLLVEYDGPAGKEYKMIPQDDLGRSEVGTDAGADAKQKFRFTGEDALISALASLTEPTKPIIYFTQGSGELALDNDEGPTMVNPRTGQEIRNLNGGGRLKARLEKRNFEVRTFNPALLGENLKDRPPAEVKDIQRQRAEIFDSAEVIVVAGPRKTLTPPAIQFLTDYMNRRGQMIGKADGPGGKPVYGAPNDQVNVGTTKVQLAAKKIEKDGRMLAMSVFQPDREGAGLQMTGLEPILMRYGIEVPDQFLLNIMPASDDPNLIVAEANPAAETKSQLAAAFKDRIFLTWQPRPLQVKPSPPGMASFNVEPILVTSAGQEVIAFSPDQPLQMIIPQLGRDRLRREELVNKTRNTPLAVAVTEASGMPAMPGHPPTGPQTPRLVVIGSSSMVSNYLIDRGQYRVNFDFFASSLEWLRDKKAIGGIEPKQIAAYSLPKNAGPNYWTFVLLPSLVIGLCIIGTGTGVWLVRRR